MGLEKSGVFLVGEMVWKGIRLHGDGVRIGKRDDFVGVVRQGGGGVGAIRVVRQGVVYSPRKIDLKNGEETTQVQCIVD